MDQLINKKSYSLIYIFIFSVYLIAGLLVHDNYGITWDEFRNKDYAQEMLKTWDKTDYDKVVGDGESHAASRGALYLIALNQLDRFFVPEDNIYKSFKVRRLINHLFFIITAVLFLFFVKKLFADERFSLISLLMFLLMPRMYAHSFYNPVDMPFLCFFTFFFISLYSLTKKITWKRLFVNAIICAVVTHLRTVGEVSVLLTLFFLLSRLIQRKRFTADLMPIVFFIFTSISIYVLITPFLWPDIFERFMVLHNYSVHYQPVIHPILYFGRVIPSNQLPWHYTLTWISITLPTIYLLGFIYSYITNLFNIKNHIKLNDVFSTVLFIFISIILIAACSFNYSKYNDWRHFYFIYPAIILLTTMTLSKISNRKRKNFIVLVFSIQFIFTIYDIASIHPHQITFFNRISGGISKAEGIFPLEYFGSSFRQSLEDINLNDTEYEVIKVAFYPFPIGSENLRALPKDMRKRFELSSAKEADYLVTKWVFEPYLTRLKNYKPYLYKSLKVKGVAIHNIYKLK